MSQTASLGIRTAQAASIFLSTFGSGANLAISFFVIPRLLESPTPLMLRQWLNSFNLNKVVIQVLGNSSALVSLVLAYHLRGAGAAASNLWLASSLLCLGMTPYTLVFVFPTIHKIMRKVDDTKHLPATEEVEEKGVKREESAKWLVDHWGMLNLGRGILLGLGGMVGMAASLSM